MSDTQKRSEKKALLAQNIMLAEKLISVREEKKTEKARNIRLEEKLRSLREENKTAKPYALVKYSGAFLLMAGIIGGPAAGYIAGNEAGYKAGNEAGYKAGTEAGYQLAAVIFNEHGASLVGDDLVIELNKNEAEVVGQQIGKIFYCTDEGILLSGKGKCETQAIIKGKEVTFRMANIKDIKDMPTAVQDANEVNTTNFRKRWHVPAWLYGDSHSHVDSRHVGSKHGHRRSRKYMHRPKRRLVPDPPTIESCGDRQLSAKFALHARVAKR